jgi:hypothetical protein
VAEPTDADRKEIIQKLARNRPLAHSFLFEHRHPQATPAFHKEIIDLWYSPAPQVLIMAMRGGAKSTLAEECVIVNALFKEFNYALVLGNSEDRATQRLAAIKYELEFNERIISIFGQQVGPTWQEKAIILSNNVAIHAYGRGQSLRGAKHLDARPDTVFVDDLEDDESVSTPEQRKKTVRWFLSALIPAMNPLNRRLRVVGTPLDPEALLPTLAKQPDWATRVYPARYIDPETNKLTALWPERFSLEMLEAEEQSFARLGERQKFAQEYLCQASDPDSKTFTQDMFQHQPALQRTWEPTFVFYDPARTTNKNSADTGKVVFSWVGPKLIIWEAIGRNWKPSEIVDDIFQTDLKYAPVGIGVERDGLEEFLMQPIRQAQVTRAHTIPVQGYRAPKGKLDFIKSLQPFFRAGEVIFAGPTSDLQDQLLAFPTGKIDVPNALAYALKMRPGKPVFDNFRMEHVSTNTQPVPRTQAIVAFAASQQYTAAVLLQYYNGQLRILNDTAVEGPPGDVVTDMLRSLSIAAGQMVYVYASPSAYAAYDRVGLLATLKAVPVDVRRGGALTQGREELRQMLNKQAHGAPAVQISTQATWTLRALSGGYAREVDRLGQISDFPKENVYKTVMEAVETVVGLAASQAAEADTMRYDYTPNGQRFLSARVT